MKAIKGRILNKLRSIPQSIYLKQGRILYLKASDALLDPSPPPPPLRQPLSDLPILSQDHNPILPDVIHVAELMKDLDDDTEDEDIDAIINKENTSVPPQPPTSWRKTHNQKTGPDTRPHTRCQGERQGLSFWPPELDSETLFDPDLLAAFEQAVTDHMKTNEEARKKPRDPIEDQERPSKIPRLDGEFEKRCPPGGEESVILYTTSLRGISKTFEGCNSVRFLLESSRVVFDERDVSMHREFRDEMWRVMEERAVPPRLFVKGRYIGGAEAVLRLHEQGRLMPLLQGVGVDRVVGSGGAACRECWGVRFVMCDKCSGGRKVYDAGDAAEECDRCNENGLLLCSVCYPAHALLSSSSSSVM